MKVKFVPQNVEFEIEAGKSVMHVAQDHGLYVKSVCKGVPNCAECRVRILEGEHNVMPPGSEELSLIGTGHFIDRRRLSCQLKCFGDITVDMSEQLAKQQGLILGNKKKAALKDDRVEEAVARRGENAVDEETSSDANEDVDHQHAPKPSRDARDVRESRETRDTRPPGAQDRGQGRRPGTSTNASSSHRGGRTEGGGDRSPRGARGPLPEHSPQEVAHQESSDNRVPVSPGPVKPSGPSGQKGGTPPGGAGPSGGQNRQQRQPRPAQQAQASRSEGEGGDPTGAGGGKRRRRRRGKGGGGAPGGSAPGGGPSSGPGRGPSA